MTGNREEIARLMEFAMVHADAAEEVSCSRVPVCTTDGALLLSGLRHHLSESSVRGDSSSEETGSSTSYI
jgi:hypothetical protein